MTPDGHHSLDGPKDVLLVEDDPEDARLVREAFEASGSGTEVHVVADGSDGVDFLAGRGEYEFALVPDLVLLDLDLPGKGGFEFLDEVKNDPRLRSVPVIVLTVSEDEEDVVRSYGAHANAYVTKPTSPDGFDEVIAKLERFWLNTVHLPPKPR